MSKDVSSWGKKAIFSPVPEDVRSQLRNERLVARADSGDIVSCRVHYTKKKSGQRSLAGRISR